MFLKHKRIILLISILVFIVVLLTSLTRNRLEGDEIIYQTLAVRLQNFQTYSLQGTELLKTIPKEIYDTKIFFYPPTFIILLSFSHFLFGNVGFHIIPPILYILFCFLIYKTVLELTKSEDNALKALVLSLFSSMALFVSVRGSMDLFMVLLTFASFYFLILYEKQKTKKYMFLSGLFITLAILTKYIPIIILVFYIPILLQIVYKNRLVKHIYLFFIPFSLIFIWFIYLFQSNPSFSFFMHQENSKVLETYKFLDYAYNRPFFFYFLNTFLVNPLYIFIFLLLQKKYLIEVIKRYGFLIIYLIEIIIFLFLSLTLIGVMGGTFQMRYILLAEPFLIILLSIINFEKYKLARILFIIFVFHNIFLFMINTMLLNFPENFSIFELLRISSLRSL